MSAALQNLWAPACQRWSAKRPPKTRKPACRQGRRVFEGL